MSSIWDLFLYIAQGRNSLLLFYILLSGYPSNIDGIIYSHVYCMRGEYLKFFCGFKKSPFYFLPVFLRYQDEANMIWYVTK